MWLKSESGVRRKAAATRGARIINGGGENGIQKPSRRYVYSRKHRRIGVATSLRFGNSMEYLSIPDGLTMVAERRGYERWEEGCAMDLPLRTCVAAIYIQGLMDMADAIGTAREGE